MKLEFYKNKLLEELKAEGFSNIIIKAFSKVPREKFIPRYLKEYSYNNEPLPLTKNSTISQPYTIAFMLNLLELDKLKDKAKILEIGSGCGYVLALINELCKCRKIKCKIFGIEVIKELVDKSKQVLKKNIRVINSDGYYGLKKYSPFDRILVSAAFEAIPEHLFAQINNNGILVAPVRNSIYQFKKLNNKENFEKVGKSKFSKKNFDAISFGNVNYSKFSKIEVKEFPGFVFVSMQKNSPHHNL